MALCETCGNEYDKTFMVVTADASHTFDSFECAIQALAPTCHHCGCRIIGHGVEGGWRVYCIDPVDSKQTGDRAVNKQLSEGVNRWLFSSPQSKIFRRGQRGQHARQLM